MKKGLCAGVRFVIPESTDRTKEDSMPKGPRGEKRPQSEVQAAVMVGKIATRQIKETQTRRLFTLKYQDKKTG